MNAEPKQPLIEDYAFISDMQSCALISRAGSVDWLCWPRFDSAACFCALLHDDSAGSWWIRPREDVLAVERRYRKDTLVLETTYTCQGGSVTVVDCLAVDEAIPGEPSPEHVFVRLVSGVEGEVPVRMEYRPRLDYGSIVPWFREHEGIIEAVGGPDALDLASSLHLQVDGGAVQCDFSVGEGDEVPFVLSYHRSHRETPVPDPARAGSLIERTAKFWTGWSDACSYEGPWRDEVVRSLLTLKALTFAPSGGVVAAATASLPEQIGGARNWDYRYCWLRDATFTLDALLEYGYTAAAVEWRDWLLRAVAGDPEDMQIMYGVLGERRLLEYELPLEGYSGSRPVRIGNAAHTQFQLDVYGELMDSFHSARRAGIETPPDAWKLEKAVVDHVCRRWREPDEGIWEVRSGPEHFVHSKVMAWVALDRGIKAIEGFGHDGPLAEWVRTRSEIREEILTRGIDDGGGYFKRSYESLELDASLLMLPLVGFVNVDDDTMINTIHAIERDLMVDGFVHRYRTDRVDDGLPPGEGTFLMCSFWLVDCLVLLGRQQDAEALFGRLVRTANDVGLFAEQYDPRGQRLLGNFPQAFSHVSHVTSAAAISRGAAPRGIRRGET